MELEMISNIAIPRFINATTVIGVLNQSIFSASEAPTISAAISFGMNKKDTRIIPRTACNAPIIFKIDVIFKTLYRIAEIDK